MLTSVISFQFPLHKYHIKNPQESQVQWGGKKSKGVEFLILKCIYAEIEFQKENKQN